MVTLKRKSMQSIKKMFGTVQEMVDIFKDLKKLHFLYLKKSKMKTINQKYTHVIKIQKENEK